jgi:Spy/CpxP family protein refolding chaperone
MKDRKFGIIFLLVLSLVIYFPLMALAQSCPKKSQQGCRLDKKIFCRLHSALANQEKLDLSDDQVAKIRELKMSTKKDLIKRDAEIDIISVDIKSKLREDKIDKENIGKLIDQKYELKKEKAKALIDACAGLKSILSVEQNKKLNNLTCQKRCQNKCQNKSQMSKCPRTKTEKSDVNQ